MSELTIIAIHQVKPEYSQTYLKAAREVVAKSQQETGCVSYYLNIDVNNPNIFVFIETWASKQAIEQHNQTAHFLTFKTFLADKLENRSFHLIKRSD